MSVPITLVSIRRHTFSESVALMFSHNMSVGEAAHSKRVRGGASREVVPKSYSIRRGTHGGRFGVSRAPQRSQCTGQTGAVRQANQDWTSTEHFSCANVSL